MLPLTSEIAKTEAGASFCKVVVSVNTSREKVFVAE